MANTIRNRMILTGKDEDIKKLYEAFNTHHESRERIAFDGTTVYLNKEGQVGWLDKKTGIFTRRDKEPMSVIPFGFSPDIIEAIDQFPDFNKVIPQPCNIFRGDLGVKERKECKRLGVPNWYDWNSEFWGTKWNSCSCRKVSENRFTFETAWNGVPLIVEEMSRKFPNIAIEYTYASEDSGYCCGTIVYGNGEPVLIDTPEGCSTAAWNTFFELWPEDKQYYTLIDGEYVYTDEDE